MSGVFELNNPDFGHLGKKPVQITYDGTWSNCVYVVCQEGERKLLKIKPTNLSLIQYWNEYSIGEAYTGELVPEYFCNYMGMGMVLSEGKLFMFNYSNNNALYAPIETDCRFSWIGTNPSFCRERYYAYDENSQTFKMLTPKTNPLLFENITTLDELNTAGQTYLALGTITSGDYGQVMYPVLLDETTQTEHYYEISIRSEYDKNWNVTYIFDYAEKCTRPATLKKEEACLLSDANYWFASRGNKLVRYFFSATSELQDWVTDLKGKVTTMMFDKDQKRIFVATYDGTKSYIYEISAKNPAEHLNEPLVTEGKVVSMCVVGRWKY